MLYGGKGEISVSKQTVTADSFVSGQTMAVCTKNFVYARRMEHSQSGRRQCNTQFLCRSTRFCILEDLFLCFISFLDKLAML